MSEVAAGLKKPGLGPHFRFASFRCSGPADGTDGTAVREHGAYISRSIPKYSDHFDNSSTFWGFLVQSGIMIYDIMIRLSFSFRRPHLRREFYQLRVHLQFVPQDQFRVTGERRKNGRGTADHGYRFDFLKIP